MGITLALLVGASTAQADFSAGAATADISPRPVNAGDVNGFGPCNSLPGPRLWADDEPYVNRPGETQFSYPDPFCDRNANGRHDQIYSSGAQGAAVPASALHDPIEARAFAISDGRETDVVVSVVAQGLFENYISQMAAAAQHKATAMGSSISHVVVSANHNESSPDTVGIYGGPTPGFSGVPSPQNPLPGIPGAQSPAGLRSGIDDYYMSYLIDRVAQAAADAAHSLRPATLWAQQFQLPPTVGLKLSNNWPTTDNSDIKPAAIDPKVGLLQARDGAGAPIFTVMSLAAHNQEIGHSGKSELSSDWPGYFARSLEGQIGGRAIFLVGDNGSQEDPCAGGYPLCAGAHTDGSYGQAQASGQAFAQAVAAQAPQAQQLRFGGLGYRRTELCVPIENNLFKAAAGAGLFGQRPGYTDPTCSVAAAPAGGVGPTPQGTPAYLRSSVSALDVGPDLQLLDNPGEAFPALMVGSPWGIEDVPAECQGRANPKVPTWRSHALFRFQVGLANDLIGYELPAWAYIAGAGQFSTSDPQCQSSTSANSPTGGPDSKGHSHKLESEGVGPTASNQVADQLSNVLEAAGADASAHIGLGRFVAPNGSIDNRSPIGAAGLLLPDPGSSALRPNGGTLIGGPGVAGFGGRAVDATGAFMDYDGQPQAAPDVTTRGIVVFDAGGCVSARYYADVYPHLDTPAPLGAQVINSAIAPSINCSGPPRTNIPEVQASVIRSLTASGFQISGVAGGRAFPRPSSGCPDRTPPHSVLQGRTRRHRRARPLVVRRGRLRLSGSASAHGCSRRPGSVVGVTVSISRKKAHRGCLYVGTDGRLTPPRDCNRPLLLLAHGTTRWTLRLRLHIPRGRYRLVVRAVDAAGNIELARARRANVVRLRVR